MKKFFTVFILMSTIAFAASAHDPFVSTKDKSTTDNATPDNKSCTNTNFPQPEISGNHQKPTTGNYDRLRFSVNGGYSYRTAKISKNIPNELHDYMNELKSGSNFSVDGTYFFSPTIGFGLKYSQYYAKNSLGDISVDYNGDGLTDHGTLKDDITISFFGPMIALRVPSANNKNALFVNFAIGYLDYKNNGSLVVPITQKGSTVGVIEELGYQVGITKNLSLALSLSSTTGVLTKVKQTVDGYTQTLKLKDDNKENLTRFDLSLGLVIHL